MQPTERNAKIIIKLSIGIGLLIIPALILFLWEESADWSSDEKIASDKFGQFGDLIGGVLGAIWAFAGVLLFYYALDLQRKDFKLQKAEMTLSRKTLEEQTKTLSIQRFENTFFSLLANHHEVVNNLSLEKTTADFSILKYDKRELFEYSRKKLNIELRFEHSILNKKIKSGVEVNSIEYQYGHTVKAYKQFFFHENRQLLGHYFRNLYHIFKFIYFSQEVSTIQKKMYSAIARAQLSSTELYLLLFNSLVPNLGYPNFLFLIHQLDILSNFDFSILDGIPYHENVLVSKIRTLENPWPHIPTIKDPI